MSSSHSRKTFLSKLAGLAALGGLAPRALANPANSAAAPASVVPPAAVPFQLRPEPRAIARREQA